MAATQRRIVSTRDQIAVVFDRCGERCEMRTAAIALCLAAPGVERRCNCCSLASAVEALRQKLRRPAL